MATDVYDVSGILALQFGGEISGTVGSSAVDLAVACAAIDGTEQIAIPMPQAGCVRALSIKMSETGVATDKTATLAVTIGGTEDSTAVIALVAGDKKATAVFDNNDLTFEVDDELGLSLTGGAATSIIQQEIIGTLFVQLGRSNI